MLPKAMTYELDFAWEKWKIKTKKYTKDMELFETYYIKHKKCDCKLIVCQHFNRALINVFAQRAKDLIDSKFLISGAYHQELLRQSNHD